ncbi:MAG: hypothetical protein LBU89_05815, partial [Fibromonadaceae bacterium]|nr:hypothetical protein [Fibromonadaceae bacterium]
LGKIIIKDVDELRKIVNGTRKLNEINNFNKHTKAYLYDIIGGSLSIEDAAGRVLLPGKYGPEAEFKPIEERNHEEEFGHDYDYWTRECEIGSREDCLDEWATECENDNVNACLEVRLASETLANISAVAVVNSEAFNAIKKYLPESYEMFVEILEDMIDRVL